MQDVRQCGVNLNYWWPVAHTEHMPKSKLRSTRVGTLELVVVQLSNGNFQVYEDACPHKRVRLSTMGKLEGDLLQCRYHGWKFDGVDGACTSLGSMTGQKQCFNLRRFPTQVYGNWVWAFLGESKLANQISLPHIPPAEQPENYYRVPMEGSVNCHFSYITENATDLYHADLHQAQQPWMNPRLVSLEESDRVVSARYEVETPRLIAALFTGNGSRKFIRVHYEYPYIHIFEENGGFYLFVTYLPQDAQSTYVFSSFYFPHILPYRWLTKLLLPLVEPILIPILNQGTFRKVFQEDIAAVQEEQRAYNLYGNDLSRDTNPTTHAVHRVIIRQTCGQSALLAESILTGVGG